jgi:hypothetical protein
MLIVFYVILVWLKIILGNSIVLLWLWIVRDRGMQGAKAWIHYTLALSVWLAPWAFFLVSQSELYQGHCGLRMGIRDCGMLEFLWGRLRWLRYGIALDFALLAGVIYIMARANVLRGETQAFRK